MKKTAKRAIMTLVILVMVLMGIVAVGCSSDDKKSAPAKDPVVYYCELNGDEYVLNLNNTTFTFDVNGALRPGKCSVKNGTYTLQFTDKIGGNTTATESDNGILTLKYNNIELRMYKKVFYTVSYNSDSGSAVEAEKVCNGKTATKPADPTRDGHTFIGWYTDATYKTPYAFGSQIVTGDITLYAQWVKKTVGQNEYTVKFDLNYEEAEQLSSKQTVSGMLFDVVTPAREGYKFNGWWVSMTGKADELGYKLEANTVFAENTTLYALWQKNGETNLETPVVNVNDNGIEWASAGATVSGYTVTITGPDNKAKTSTITTTSMEIDFASMDAGDYRIEVTAKSSGGQSLDSEKAVRVYRNKGLARVSLFSVVEPSVFLFNEVENATSYEIDIVCGDEAHNHNPFNNGSSTNYNFINCEMPEDGIMFTVTANADGYMSSTSEPYSYKRLLDAIDAVTVDEDAETAKWTAVKNATNYIVSIKSQNSTTPVIVDNGSSTSISLKEFGAGELTINVYPSTKGYCSPAATVCVYNKETLASPTDIAITGDILSWQSTGATDYKVSIAGKVIDVTGKTSLDLSSNDLDIDWRQGADYNVAVKSVSGGKESAWSNAVDARYYALYSKLSYTKNTVSWRYVIGADSYEVRVNGGTAVTVEGKNSAKVQLTQAGDNLIQVRFNDGGNRSAWADLHVNAYSITFDARGAEGSLLPLFLAYGDEVQLGDGAGLQKTGHSLDGWYTTPSGASGNGARYSDAVYSESGNTTLYANWKANKYTITLDYNEIGSGNVTTFEVTYGKNYVLPIPTEINNGMYSFVGWFSTSSEQGGIQYTDEDGNSTGAWTLARDAKIYAGWRSVLSFYKENDTYTVKQGKITKQITTITVPAEYKGEDDDKAYPVVNISDTAFKSCTDLETVNIPNTVTYIDMKAFQSCTSLKAINIIKAVGVNEFVYESEDGVLYYNNQTTGVKDLWFYPRAKDNTLFKLPDDVANIPSKSLYYSLFDTIIIPDSVEYVAQEAFYYTNSLKTVTFEAHTGDGTGNDLIIAPGAFRYSTYIEDVTLPARYKNFDRSIFYNCSRIKKVDGQPDSKYAAVKTYTTDAAKTPYYVLINKETKTLLYCPQTVSGEISIPDEVSVIGERAYSACSKITKVTIPNHITEIGKQAFAGYTFTLGTSTATTTVSSSGVTLLVFAGGGIRPLTIGESAFGYEEADKLNTSTRCSLSRGVTFESDCSVAVIGKRAFSGCYFKSIELPNSVTELKEKAFADCTSMSAFTFAESDEYDADRAQLSVGANCFSGCIALTSIKLPYYLTQFSDSVFGGCSKLASISVDDNNPSLAAVDGVLYNKDITTVIYYPAARTDDYEIPATVTTISGGVFAGRTNLVNITIGKNVVSIGANAFKSCTELLTVTFESGRATGAAGKLTVGASAFESCSKLTTVTFNDVVMDSIPDKMFYSCKLLSTISIPASVTEIGKQAFYYCSGITGTLTISKNVTKLGYQAFYYCSGLNRIEFEGNRTTDIAMYSNSNNTTADTSTFCYCTNVTEVVLPERLINIGNNAFGNCSKLEKINIPTTVKNIYKKAFYYCSALYQVNFDDATYDLTFEENTSSSYAVFYYCKQLTEFSFPVGVKRIPAYCFYNCTALETVHIPYTVENTAWTSGVQKIAVERNAFESCTGLKYVVFDELDQTSAQKGLGTGELSFNIEVFKNCTSLQTLNLPARLASWHNAATTQATALTYDTIMGCTSLTTINVLDKNGNPATATKQDENGETVNNVNYTSDGGLLLKDYGATLALCPLGKGGEITIPYSVNLVNDQAFYMNAAVTDIKFAAKPESEQPETEALTDEEEAEADLVIGSTENKWTVATPTNMRKLGVFSTCSNLQTVIFPARLKTINGFAFYNCVNLETVTFEGLSDNTARLSYIGDAAFEYCKLGSVKIANPVTEIGRNAFNQAKSLSQLSFEGDSKLTKIGESAFQNTAVVNVTIPSKVTAIGINTFSQCFALTSITLPGAVSNVANTLFTDCIKLGTITVTNPNTLDVVDSVAFLSNGEKLVSYPQGKTGDTYYVPHGVTEITDYAFAYNPYITTVYIPNTVKKVGNYAFYMCRSLTTVKFEDNDNCGTSETADAEELQVGSYAFASCSILDLVKLPARFNSMGTYMFAYCSKLREVNIDSGCDQLGEIADYAFYYCGIQSFTIPSCVQTIGTQAFRYSSLNTIEIPSSVTKIGKVAAGYVFANCPLLTYVEFKDGGTTVTMNNYTFYQCPELLTLKLSKAVKTTGTNMCNGCEKLNSVTFGTTPGLETIAADAFTGCSDLTSITLPSTLVTINAAFKNTGLTSIIIPASVTTLVASAFSGSPIATITFASDSEITSLVASAFTNMTSLTRITLPDSLTSIGNYALQGTGITSITLPENLETIGNYVFSGCKELRTVTFNENLVTIGDRAFQNCSKLQTVDLPDSLETIGYYAFTESGLTSLTVPSGVEEICGRAFDSCLSLQSVEFAPNSSLKELKYISNLTKYGYAFYNCTSLESVVLPDSIESIGSYSFCGTSLKSVTFPATLKEIDAYAFQGCSDLSSITFLKNSDGAYALTTIGNYAFSGTAITSVSLPNTLKTLGSYAFYNCSELESATIDMRDNGTCDLETIEIRAFYNCGELENFFIPASVTTIGQNPFLYCRKLTLELDPANTHFKMIDGILYTADTTMLLVCPGAVGGEVFLPSACVEIRAEAFVASGVTSIAMSKTGFTIGSWAFNACQQLESVIIGDEAILGDRVFRWCTSLTDVSLGYDIVADVETFLHCTALESIFIPNGCKLPADAFAECTNLSTVDLDEDAEWNGILVSGDPDDGNSGGTITISENIVDEQFKNNTAIASVVIAEGVTTIGRAAFAGCTNLVSVQLPSTLTTINGQAFQNCSSLTTINLEETSLETLGENITQYYGGSVFYGCTMLETVVLPDTLTFIGQYAFQNSGIKTIEIPQNALLKYGTYGGYQFAGCKQLETVTFAPDNINTRIPQYAFYDSGIQNIVFPAGLTSIDDNAFYDYYEVKDGEVVNGYDLRLESITIPNTVTTINGAAFRNNVRLTELTFEEGSQITTFGKNAFRNTGIVNLSIPATAKTFSVDSFSGSGQPPAASTYYNSAPFSQCADLETVTFEKNDEGSYAITSFNSYMFQSCVKLQSITIPYTVTSIQQLAFDGCTMLSEVIFEEKPEGGCSLTTIGSGVFNKTAIVSMELPDTVSSLSSAFVDSQLQSIKLPLAFMTGTSTTADLFKNITTLETVIIPEGATKLNGTMFSGCTGISSIIIPSTCSSVGSLCFDGWTSEQTIYFEGLTGPLSTWNNNWNGGRANLVWNWQPEQTEQPEV